MALYETRKELEKRMEELARKHAETHDEDIKAQLEELNRRVADMRKGWFSVGPSRVSAHNEPPPVVEGGRTFRTSRQSSCVSNPLTEISNPRLIYYPRSVSRNGIGLG